LGYEIEAGRPKTFHLLEIREITITNTPYIEREYPIEINASGHAVMPPVRRNIRRF
jgi:hypothetical protein